MVECSFHRKMDVVVEEPTFIEGLPGHGLVATIAVDLITKQLELDQYGGIRSPDIPQVLSFTNGRVQDSVRVYTGKNPDVLTLLSDVMLPPDAYRSFSKCILSDLASEFNRGFFLAAAPARSEEQRGEVLGVATNESMERDLIDAGISLAEGDGLVGGITGALVNECFNQNVPAALILVRADPYAPDPEAARIVIETALEPLVDFDIDTSELSEKANRIQEEKEQVISQLQKRQQQQPESTPSIQMFQ